MWSDRKLWELSYRALNGVRRSRSAYYASQQTLLRRATLSQLFNEVDEVSALTLLLWKTDISPLWTFQPRTFSPLVYFPPRRFPPPVFEGLGHLLPSSLPTGYTGSDCRVISETAGEYIQGVSVRGMYPRGQCPKPTVVSSKSVKWVAGRTHGRTDWRFVACDWVWRPTWGYRQ